MILAPDMIHAFARRFAPWLALAAIALLLALAGPAACRKYKSEAARARLGEAKAESASRSGRDAVATVGAAARREQQSDQLTTTNMKEILNAQGAAVPVDPAVRDAGHDGLCRRAAYRDDERCRLRRFAPR